jgi:hypothetical protein
VQNSSGSFTDLALFNFSKSHTKFDKKQVTFLASTFRVSISAIGKVVIFVEDKQKAKLKNFFLPPDVFAAGKMSPDVSHETCSGRSHDDSLIQLVNMDICS